MAKKKAKAKAKSKESVRPPGYTTGRPTDYRQEYCEQLISHMKEGLSFESFAGLIGMTRASIYTWTEKHPEFLDAKKCGQAASQYWWETLGRAGTGGQLSRVAREITHPDGKVEKVMTRAPFSAAGWIFNMKNRFKWRDRHEITGAGGGPIQVKDVSDLTDEEIQKELDDLEEKGI